jgi:uncharacterized protein (DUF1499 family)
MLKINPLLFAFCLLAAHIPLIDALNASETDSSSEIPIAPCPSTPNCVSSLASEEKQFIEPFRYPSTYQAAYDALVGLLEAEPRATIIDRRPHLVQSEFRSKVFKFVDDVTFFFDSRQGVIHVRSASRQGRYDFGANRKRLERLRSQLQLALTPKEE